MRTSSSTSPPISTDCPAPIRSPLDRAVHGDASPKGHKVAPDRALHDDLVCGGVQVVVNHFVGAYDHLISTLALNRPPGRDSEQHRQQGKTYNHQRPVSV